MSNIEKVKAEIERRKKENMYDELPMTIGRYYEDRDLLAFIDSLPDENNPEPYNPVYDEDYLNEKIAKATKSWEGVDVNKMLADCRGYEEESSYVTDSPGDPGNPGEPGISDLEEEMERMWLNWCEDVDYLSYLSIASYFAEWGAKHLK